MLQVGLPARQSSKLLIAHTGSSRQGSTVAKPAWFGSRLHLARVSWTSIGRISTCMTNETWSLCKPKYPCSSKKRRVWAEVSIVVNKTTYTFPLQQGDQGKQSVMLSVAYRPESYFGDLSSCRQLSLCKSNPINGTRTLYALCSWWTCW